MTMMMMMMMSLWNFDNAGTTFYNVIVVPALLLIVFPFVFIVAILLPVVWYWNVGRVPRTTQTQVHAFFHPYCSGGGGGERVLWKIVQSLQSDQDGPKKVIIFTVDPPGTDERKVREEAQRRFDVQITHPVELVSLEDCRHYLNPRPFLSLVMESWGTMQLANEALRRYAESHKETPIDVYWDTTGCAFTFLVARWMSPSSWILAYVHYPTISTDMMAWEWQQSAGRRPLHKTMAKMLYYWFFAIIYGMVGSLADLVMVNSTWTFGHIKRLWGLVNSGRIHIVYPPCRVPPVAEQEEASGRSRTIVSIGQFRPEKDHTLQIKSLARLFEIYPQHKQESVQLLLIGSCRNEQDQSRVDALKKLVVEHQLQPFVKFSINPPYKELQESMDSALIGIHTMRQEHFGIGIVEMMAAGLIVVAHDSGGPKTDIVQHKVTGFLATSKDEYAEALHEALTLPAQQTRILREQARESATRFSDQVFDQRLPAVLSKLMRNT